MTFDDPVPFDEAVEYMRRKGLLPTTMSSAELSRLKQAVIQRAVFSARMSKMEVVQLIKRDVTSIVSGMVDPELGVELSIPEAKARLRESLESVGWTTDPEDVGTIKDFYSDRRRQLIVETNVLDTLGYGRFTVETSGVSLDVNPAWELVRARGSEVPRNWPKRWQEAGEYVGFEGASEEKMIALKTSPIWQALGDGIGGYTDTLGNPWFPFAFQSGMITIQKSRAIAEKLGLIQPGQVQQSTAAAQALNEKVSASLKSFDSELMAVFQNDPLFIAERERIRLRAANAAFHLNARFVLGNLKEAA